MSEIVSAVVLGYKEFTTKKGDRRFDYAVWFTESNEFRLEDNLKFVSIDPNDRALQEKMSRLHCQTVDLTLETERKEFLIKNDVGGYLTDGRGQFIKQTRLFYKLLDCKPKAVLKAA